jgi:hypothetical protein
MDCSKCYYRGRRCDRAKAVLEDRLRPFPPPDICPLMLETIKPRRDKVHGQRNRDYSVS